MNISRGSFYVFTLLLIVVGVGLMIHRHTVFDVPWLPGDSKQLWTVEAKVQFDAVGDSVKASLAIPRTQENFIKVEEYTASPGYGLSFIEPLGLESSELRAEWSIRKAKGKQTLYYRVDMLRSDQNFIYEPLVLPDNVQALTDNPYDTLARQMLENSQLRSADNETLARELINEFKNQSESSTFLQQKKPRVEWLIHLLNISQVPAKKISVLTLEDGRRRQSLISYLMVDVGDKYKVFDIKTGKPGLKRNQLIWQLDAISLLDVVGGEKSQVLFSVIEQDVPANSGFQAVDKPRNLLDFSIHSLPVNEQALFKGILLIPVGVLIVVMFRLLIGLKTSGTFMPVLIAMAFLQTSLITGLIGFFVIVFVGLIVRGYLSRLNLLLVARISAVIIFVIGIISVLAITAYKLSWTDGLKITFFPMIILSWTVERMSILWEEEGSAEVFKQGGGSLFVAVICYAVMQNDIIRHLTFNFLSLQLVIMAFVLMLGTYTGYRLVELKRFTPLINKDMKNSDV